jgi:hypothetical protein
MAACDLSELVSDSAGLNALSASEKQEAFLYYLAKALLGSGGADYSDINDLRAAVKCWCAGGIGLDSFKARVAINAAVNSGAISSAPTMNEVITAIRCWNCGVGGGELKAMEVFLLCSLLEAVV